MSRLFSLRTYGGGSPWGIGTLPGLVDEWSMAQGVESSAALDLVAASEQYLEHVGDALLLGNGSPWWRAISVVLDQTGTQRILNAHGGTDTGWSVYTLGTTIAVDAYDGTSLHSASVAISGGLQTGVRYHIYIEYTGTRIRIAVNGGAFSTSGSDFTFTPTGGNPFQMGALWLSGGALIIQETDGRLQDFCGGSDVPTDAARVALAGGSERVTFADRPVSVLDSGDTGFWFPLDEGTGNRRCVFGSGLVLAPRNAPGRAASTVGNGAYEGAPISRWVGVHNGVAFAQSDLDKQPVWRADAGGSGIPGLDFDGTDDWLEATFTSKDAPYDIFTLAGLDATGAQRCLLGWDSASRFDVDGTVGGDNDWRLNAGASLAKGGADTDEHLWGLRVNGASSAIRDDKAELVAGDAGGASVGTLRLGARSVTAQDFWDGHVRRMLLCGRLSDADLARVEEAFLPS